MATGLTRLRSFGWRIACVTLLSYVLILQSLFVPFQRAQAQGFSGIEAALKVLCLTGAQQDDTGQDKPHCDDMPCCLPGARHEMPVALVAAPAEMPAFAFVNVVGEAWQDQTAFIDFISEQISPLQPRAPPQHAA